MKLKALEISSIPSLLSTAKLAYELTSQEWSQIGRHGSTSDLNILTEQILAVMLIRLLAIVHFRSRNNMSCCPLNQSLADGNFAEEEGVPQQFLDLSCTTMCRTIIAQSEGFVIKRTICGKASSVDDVTSGITKDSLDSSASGSKKFGLSGSIHGCSLMEDPQIAVQRITDSSMKKPLWPKAMSEEVIQELRMYIYSTLANYKKVHYHSCEHAFHVFMSANKLLDMMLCSQIWPTNKEDHTSTTKEGRDECNEIAEHWPTSTGIRPTYGIKDNPLSQFALLFSALVHDVEHTGVCNRQLVLESDELALLYNDQSVAEQRSLSIAFKVINKEKYKSMRKAMFGDSVDGDEEKYREFRKVVIDLVLCTDIASPERMQIVKSAWKEAFVDVCTKPKVTKAASSQRLGKGPSFELSNNTIPSPAISILCGDESESGTDIPLVQKFIEARYSLAVELNLHPKPVRIPRNQTSLDQLSERRGNGPFSNENSTILPTIDDSDLSTGDEGDKDDDGQSSGSYLSYSSSLEMESSDELYVKSPSSASRHRKRHSDVAYPLEKLSSDSAIVNGPINTSVDLPPVGQPEVQSSKKIGFFYRVIKKKEKVKYLARCYPFSRKRDQYKGSNQSKVTKSRTRTTDSKVKSSQQQHLERQESLGSRQTLGSKRSQGSKRASASNRIMRRNSAPGGTIYDRKSLKKFRFRLGIRRALDLSGNTIEAFTKTKNAPNGLDSDQRDNLKANVVLEQMLKAADVSATMQVRMTL